MNFYDFHIGDYASRTAHLEPMEDLAYRRMLDLYYIREQHLPADVSEVARLIRLRGQEEVIRAVLGEFFEQVEDGWTHSRCEEVIAAAQEKRGKAKQSAAARWGKKDEGSERSATAVRTHSERIADAMQSECEGNAPSPTTQSQSHIPPKPPRGQWFDRFWKAYPSKVGKEAARKAFDKAVDSENTLLAVLAALEWQVKSEKWTKDGGQYIPNPATYLNQGRWQDEPQAAAGAPAAAPRMYDNAEETRRMLEKQRQGTTTMPPELRAVVAQMTGRKAA